jgi:hypothetical protein
VLIDFPELTAIGARRHPYEELLINYMRTFRTVLAPWYLDPAAALHGVVDRRGRVLWGSTPGSHERSLTEARALDLDDEAMALFLGGTARRLSTHDRALRTVSDVRSG